MTRRLFLLYKVLKVNMLTSQYILVVWFGFLGYMVGEELKIMEVHAAIDLKLVGFKLVRESANLSP